MHVHTQDKARWLPSPASCEWPEVLQEMGQTLWCMSWSSATPGMLRLLLRSRVAMKGAPAACGVGMLPGCCSLWGLVGCWNLPGHLLRGHGVIWWEGRRCGSSVPVQGINRISEECSLGQCSMKLCLLGLKPFAVTSPQGIVKAHSKLQSHGKLPFLGVLHCGLGRRGSERAVLFPVLGTRSDCACC